MAIDNVTEELPAYSYNQPVYMLFTDNNDLLINIYFNHANMINDDFQYIIGSIFSLVGIYIFIIKIIEAVKHDI